MNLEKYLGKALTIYLFAGGAFYFKVTGCHEHYLVGYDGEGMNLTIDINDISHIFFERGQVNG